MFFCSIYAHSEPPTREKWTIYFQLKGKPEEDEFIDTDVDKVHITFHNLVYFKEQFGYGARDFLYYKKRCGTDVARLEPIEYLRDAQAMLKDNAAEKEIRLVMSKEPETEVNVAITPIKRHRRKRKNHQSSTDQDVDVYKAWLQEQKEDNPDIGIINLCITHSNCYNIMVL